MSINVFDLFDDDQIDRKRFNSFLPYILFFETNIVLRKC